MTLSSVNQDLTNANLCYELIEEKKNLYFYRFFIFLIATKFNILIAEEADNNEKCSKYFSGCPEEERRSFSLVRLMKAIALTQLETLAKVKNEKSKRRWRENTI